MKFTYVKAVLGDIQVKILVTILKIVFPKYPFAFFLYIFLKYYVIRNRERLYTFKIVNTDIIYHLATSLEENAVDDNYYVLVNNRNIKGEEYSLLCVKYQKKLMCRYVKVLFSIAVNENTIGISALLMYNIANSAGITCFTHIDIHEFSVQIKCLRGVIRFADEVHLSLVNSSNDLENRDIDIIVKNYFNKPKIIHECDTIAINVQNYCERFPWNLTKMTNLQNLVFLKCKNLQSKIVHNSVAHGYFVVLGETTLRQTNNIQSFIPPYTKVHPNLNRSNIQLEIEEKGIGTCPYGLEKYAEQIELTIRPFLERRYQIFPAFLLAGKKGCGKEILISNISSKYGMQFYNITNFDVTAHLYAHNETKLKNIFVNAKLCAPCMIYIENFENFEKNNEGQSDDRIMSHFTSALKYLFTNNEYPVILFCSCNEEHISGKLKRQFIETFKINSLTIQERTRILKWLMDNYNVSFEGCIQEVASKTPSFSFDDLHALVQKAINLNSVREKQFSLDIESFSSAIEYMQLQYNENICTPRVPKVLWEDIGGLAEVKKEIIETINFPLKHPDIFLASGLRKFGILLFGPPGTGKTLLAKAVATECNLCFLSVKGPELLNMYIGQSEENIREVFDRARAAAPCIIFFDEVDSLAPKRGVSGDSGGVMDRVVSQLLTEMDGLTEKATIFIIGATNRPDLIDPALLRPGRFDRHLFVGPSIDFASRLSVLKALTRKFCFSGGLSLEDIIRICPENISGADFYGICADTWTRAIGRYIQKNEDGANNTRSETAKDVSVRYDDFKSALTSVHNIRFEELT